MLNKRFVTLPTVNSCPLVLEVVFWSILSSLFTVPLNRRTRMESIFWTASASERFSTLKKTASRRCLSNHEQKARKIHASSSTFPIENPSIRPGASPRKKIQKTPSVSTVKMDGISFERYRRSMNLLSFLLPGLRAERCDFLVENRSGASAVQKTNYWFHPRPSKRNCKRTNELKILQNCSKYHFWGKRTTMYRR